MDAFGGRRTEVEEDDKDDEKFFYIRLFDAEQDYFDNNGTDEFGRKKKPTVELLDLNVGDTLKVVEVSEKGEWAKAKIVSRANPSERRRVYGMSTFGSNVTQLKVRSGPSFASHAGPKHTEPPPAIKVTKTVEITPKITEVESPKQMRPPPQHPPKENEGTFGRSQQRNKESFVEALKVSQELGPPKLQDGNSPRGSQETLLKVSDNSPARLSPDNSLKVSPDVTPKVSRDISPKAEIPKVSQDTSPKAEIPKMPAEVPKIQDKGVLNQVKPPLPQESKPELKSPILNRAVLNRPPPSDSRQQMVKSPVGTARGLPDPKAQLPQAKYGTIPRNEKMTPPSVSPVTTPSPVAAPSPEKAVLKLHLKDGSFRSVPITMDTSVADIVKALTSKMVDKQKSMFEISEISPTGSRVLEPDEKPMRLMSKWINKDEKKFHIHQKMAERPPEVTEKPTQIWKRTLSKEKDDLDFLMTSLEQQTKKASPPKDDSISAEELESLLADLVQAKYA